MSSDDGNFNNITKEAQEEQYERQRLYYRKARLEVYKVVMQKPPNMANAIYKPLQSFFFELLPGYVFRQRFFVSVAYLDMLKEKPFFLTQEQVNDIVSEFVFVAGQILNKQGENFLFKQIYPSLDPQLIFDVIKILCRIKIKQDRHDIIPIILNLEDYSSKYVVYLYSTLEKYITINPRVVFSWINRFKLTDFKQTHFYKLALVCYIHELDITKQLFDDDDARKKVVMYLDQFAVRHPIPKNDLERQFLNKFELKTICERVYKHAHEGMFKLEEVIPNTISERRIADYGHQLYSSKDILEKNVVTIQALKNVVKYPTILKRMFEAARMKNENVAQATAYVLKFDSIVGLKPFDTLFPTLQRNLKDLMNMVEKVVDDTPDEYVDRTFTSDFEIILVDTHEKFDDFLGWLTNLRDCAFDIEANFVCQSSNASQQAALLQLADNMGRVFLLDICVLKNKLNSLIWRSFFEAFFRPRLKRIGFDINNDIRFLQATFPQLREFLADRQPDFHDLKKLTEVVISNSDVKENVFGDRCPSSISLENLIKSLLGRAVDKTERVSNWEVRPLREEQMVYAALDAYYSMKCFKDMQKTIFRSFDDNNEGKEFLNQCVIIPKPIGQNPNATVQVPTSRKETFDDILNRIRLINNKLAGFESRNSEEILIVVDCSLLKVVPLLRRCGYRTFDHRETAGDKAQKSQILSALSDFLTENYKSDGTVYFLSNKFPFKHENFVASLKTKFIEVKQEQSESSIIEAVMLSTKTVVDTRFCSTRCSKCFDHTTSFEFPITAYRLCYRSYAKHKEYYDKKFKDEDPQELDEKDKQELDTVDYIHFESCDRIMVVTHNDDEWYKFTIDGTTSIVEIFDGRILDYKPETRLYEHESLEFVRFCKECAVFF